MMMLGDRLRALLIESLEKEFPEYQATPHIEYPANREHGDFSTNVAFEIAKSAHLSPREVAQKIIASLPESDLIAKVETAGAGFINFFINSKFLTRALNEIVLDGARFGTSEKEKGKTVVTDHSHPNVAKPMGVHHLLSTIIGDSITRIFSAVGYKVIRDNYLGDWGTQFGKLMYAYKTWGDKDAVKKNPIPELLKLYVRFHDESEKNPELDDFGRAEFKKLEQGDATNKVLWKWVVDLSMKEFYRIWKRLDVSFDFIHGESFYEDKMQAIIDEGIAKGIFVTGERGALICPFSHEKYPPCIIRKSDGATIYATRDLARIKYWEHTWHPDLMINVVDAAQSMYFAQLFETASMLGITKAPNVHVWFGRMSFPGHRMSTRKGNIIEMEEVLNEAEERALAIVREKNPELPGDTKKEVAAQVGIGAVKYAVLSQNRTTNVTFTWDKMLSLEGNSGPYIQYAHARACSILRKATHAGAAPANRGDIAGQAGHGAPTLARDRQGTGSGAAYILEEPQELALARLLPKFPEIVFEASRQFKPSLIATYLFDVAHGFNSFYASVPVIQAPKQERAVRLVLVAAAATVLKNGLALLGISAPEEM